MLIQHLHMGKEVEVLKPRRSPAVPARIALGVNFSCACRGKSPTGGVSGSLGQHRRSTLAASRWADE